MEVKMAPSWNQALATQFEAAYFKSLSDFVCSEYQAYDCYPKQEEIFEAFSKTDLNKIKVVIIGQDPYHGPGQAHGLCFSVPDGVAHPPSLVNIFKELQTDVGKEIPSNGNLNHWAEQGVLLLNATLSVRAHQAGSHQKKGWEQFTDAVIEVISSQREGIVFMLWGGFAKKKGARVDAKKHLVLQTGHPSPLSANRGYWFGNKHFSQANAYLRLWGKSEIKW
ncbi:MAG: uracil-DNA glycosylase [Gilvibacter sp.]